MLEDSFPCLSSSASALRQILGCVARGFSSIIKQNREAGHVLVLDKPRELFRSEGVVQMARTVDVAREDMLSCTGTTSFLETRNHMSLEM
jgi:hypothetical protein